MVEVLLLIEPSNQFRMHEIPQLPPSPPPTPGEEATTPYYKVYENVSGIRWFVEDATSC